jgi:hypothetical protein
MRLDPTLLDIIACPACHCRLEPDDTASELACTGCEFIYPVRDGIPVLLVEEARHRNRK